MNQENEKQISNPDVNKEQTIESSSNTENTNLDSQERPAPIRAESAQIVETSPTASSVMPEEPTEAPIDNHQPKIQDEVLFNIKEEKDGSILGVLFFFIVIFIALYFLPTISNELSKFIPWINNTSETQTAKKTSEEPKESEKTTEQKKEVLYDLNGFVSNAGIDDLQLGNFVKDNNTGVNKLNFYILNNGDNVFIFNDNTKFFIDLYEGEKYLSSALVYSYKDIGPKESIDFSVTLLGETYKKANKFKIVRKNRNEYNTVNLSKQEGEYKILTCTLNNNTIEYLFIDNYLEVINDNYTENRDNPNYDQDIANYRNEGTKYDTIPSIDYNVIETNEGFNIKTKIDLQGINDSEMKKLAVYKYFSYHKESKVVSFEMISLGYKCS